MAASPPRLYLEPQTTVGAYQVTRLLGTGSMGAVYEAVHGLLRKRVALKLMHGDLRDNQTLVDRFLREGRAAVAIQHPHVVQVSNVGFHQGLPYLVMDLLEGEDLRQALAERGRYEPQEACDLLLPVVAAVAAAHDAGVVHRDLKPENVFLVRPGRHERAAVIPKVVDFGIARLADGGARTATHTVIGSPAYMAPEQCNGQTHPACDQWALGVMLYELCTGELPFQADSNMALMYKICTVPARPAEAQGVTLPPMLTALLERALRKEPEERFPSMRALGAALLPLCSNAAQERHRHELTTRPSARPSLEPMTVVRALPAPAPPSIKDTLTPTSTVGEGAVRRLTLGATGLVAAGVLALLVLRPAAPRSPERSEGAGRPPRAGLESPLAVEPPAPPPLKPVVEPLTSKRRGAAIPAEALPSGPTPSAPPPRTPRGRERRLSAARAARLDKRREATEHASHREALPPSAAPLPRAPAPPAAAAPPSAASTAPAPSTVAAQPRASSTPPAAPPRAVSAQPAAPASPRPPAPRRPDVIID